MGTIEVACNPKEIKFKKELDWLFIMYHSSKYTTMLSKRVLLIVPIQPAHWSQQKSLRNDKNELGKSNLVLCVFEGENSPEKLFLFDGRIVSRHYNEKPMQSKHCLKLGQT